MGRRGSFPEPEQRADGKGEPELTPQVEQLVKEATAPEVPAQPAPPPAPPASAPAPVQAPAQEPNPQMQQTAEHNQGSANLPAVAEERPVAPNAAAPAASTNGQQPRQQENNRGFGGYMFSAMPPTPAVHIAPPQKRENKSTAITLRCTEEVRDEFRQNVHIMAGVNRMTVEDVNVFVLQEIMEIFPRVQDRITEWKQQG